jgi:hypothetical protein
MSSVNLIYVSFKRMFCTKFSLRTWISSHGRKLFIDFHFQAFMDL